LSGSNTQELIISCDNFAQRRSVLCRLLLLLLLLLLLRKFKFGAHTQTESAQKRENFQQPPLLLRIIKKRYVRALKADSRNTTYYYCYDPAIAARWRQPTRAVLAARSGGGTDKKRLLLI
jgi:hypothetical protein